MSNPLEGARRDAQGRFIALEHDTPIYDRLVDDWSLRTPSEEVVARKNSAWLRLLAAWEGR